MDTHAKDKAQTTAEKIKAASLLEQAPAVININRRYYKFYSDQDTVNGGILERSYLTDNWAGDGLRDELVDAGVYFDVAMTQFVGGNAQGGTKERANYFGSLDLWANLDTAQLSNGLWSGAEISLHGEVAWGRDIQNRKGLESSVGAAVPVNYDTTMPLAANTGIFVLSEYSVVQALSPKVSLWVGQSNGAALIDGNAVAGSERHQFLNTSLVENAAVGAFAPYTCTSIAAVWTPSPEHLFLGSVMDSEGRSNKGVWRTYETDSTLGMLSYGWMPEFDGKPGRYQVVVAYTNTDTVTYDVSNRLALFEEVLRSRRRRTTTSA